MEFLVTVVLTAVITTFFVHRHMRELKRRDAEARRLTEQGKLHSGGPRAQHPHIDANACIGCATCARACPEGDVLAMLGGKAGIVNGHKCIGHGLCAEACPVGAITMMLSLPSVGADMPTLTPEYETTIPNLFIAGELGGLALIKNAVNQGRDCVDVIAARLAASKLTGPAQDTYDVVIVGAGPAGISASLRAIENKLRYITLEQDEVGGTVAKYPRQKLVMTSPVEFPMYGKFKKMELSKEELLALWHKVLKRADFNVRAGERVENITRGADGHFIITSTGNRYVARAVVLALGRTGTPRKLGVEGEELPKVMYRLLEADHYTDRKILVVGGGDSAIEAALGLANQRGNQVTLSYRQANFSRINARNGKRVDDAMRSGKMAVLFNSRPLKIRPEAVVLEINGSSSELSNDYVWVFAGGTPPYDFLKKIGVGFGARDLTLETGTEARQLVL